MPFEIARLDRAAAIIQHDFDDAETVGIDRRRDEAGRGDQPQFALAFDGTLAQTLDQRFAAVDAEHRPAHEVSAVQVGPQQKNRGQRPHVTAAFEDRHRHREQNERHQERAALLKIDRDRAGGHCRADRAQKASIAPPDHQTDQPAEYDQQQRARKHQPGETGGRVNQIHDDLRQPFVRQVEVAGLGFAGVGAGEIAGVAERVGDGERVGFERVAAGHQVEPDVGVGDLAGEPGEQQQRGEYDEGGLQPAAAGAGDGAGAAGLAGWRMGGPAADLLVEAFDRGIGPGVIQIRFEPLACAIGHVHALVKNAEAAGAIERSVLDVADALRFQAGEHATGRQRLDPRRRLTHEDHRGVVLVDELPGRLRIHRNARARDSTDCPGRTRSLRAG